MTRLFIFIVLILNSCTSHTENNLILGAWISQKDNKPVNEQLVFNKDNTLFLQSLLNGVPRTERIMNYQISANGKTLSMKEKDGKLQEVEIIELSKNALRIKTKNSIDTVYFKKQQTNFSTQ